MAKRGWKGRAREESKEYGIEGVQYGYSLQEFYKLDHPEGYAYQIMHILATPAGSDKDEQKGYGYVTERGFADNPQDAVDQAEQDIRDFRANPKSDLVYIGTYILVVPRSGEYVKGASPFGRYPA
jgi:hypothetical protein